MPNYASYSPGAISNQKFTYKNDDGEFHIDELNGKSIYKFTPGDGSFHADPLRFVRFATMRLDAGGSDSGTIYQVPNESFFLFFSTQRKVDAQGKEYFRFYYSFDGARFDRWLTNSGTSRLPLQVPVPPPPPPTTTPPPGQGTGPTPTAFPIVVDHKNTDGDTTAYGTAKISKQPTKGLIELEVRVKKTGINGKGFGYGQVALLDKDGNTLFVTKVVSENVGADALAGVNEGKHSESFEFPIDLLKYVANAVVIVEGKNNNGLPDSLAEFTEKLIEVRDFLRAVVGVLTEVAKIYAIVAGA